jgi:predicted deacylase
MTGSDLSHRRLPIMTAESENPGPLVWLTACGHGDEVSGIIVIQEIFKHLRRGLLCGAVYAFPLMNPLGFETGSRNITVSREDLNRSFPGNPRGSLGERMADVIFNSIIEGEPKLVLDLHNDWIESIPYVLLDQPTEDEQKVAYRKSVQAGRESGLCLIIDTDVIKSSLSYNLLRKNIPALTIELGKANVVSEYHVTYGVESIWNILACLEMVACRDTPYSYPLPADFGSGKLLRYSDRPYSSRTGIIRFLVKPGDVVRSGQALVKIVNAFGRHQETLNAIEDAIVLGYSDSSAAFPGKPVMAFGILHPQDHGERNGSGGARQALSG